MVDYTGVIPAGETVSVDFQTVLLPAAADAADNADFVAASGTITFTDAISSRTISIEVNEDTDIEADESLQLLLDNITTANGFGTGFADGAASNTANGTIVNDDNAAPGDGVAFDSASFSVNEGNTPADNVTLDFVVDYTGVIPAGETVSVDFQTVLLPAAADAADNADFVAASGTITFTDAISSRTISIEVNEDTDIEADESLQLLLDNITTANGFGTGFADGAASNTANGTILNDDNAAPGDGVAFDSASFSVNEGLTPADNVTLDFVVDYTGVIPAGETVSVDFQTVLLPPAADAADNADFVAASGTITFTDAISSRTISIEVNEDTDIEADESLQLLLDNITTANGFGTGFADGAASNTANGTILNDDNAAPGDGVAFDSASFSVNEGDTPADNVTLDFVVDYTGVIPAGETVSVDFQTVLLPAAADAADNADFVAASGTITFTDAISSRTISIEVNEDTDIEADESLQLLLDNITTANGFGTGFADGTASNTANGTILNDDNAAPGDGVAFDSASFSVDEGNTPADNVTLDFVVDYTGVIPAGETVSVDFQTVLLPPAADAADNADFVAASGTITFTDAISSRTISIEVNEDTDIEADESLQLLLDNITTANGFGTGFADGAASNTANGTILNDDNAAPGDGVAFDSASFSVNEGDTPADNVTLDFVVDYTGVIPAGETVSVDFQTVLLPAAADAADNADFVAASGTITFTDAISSRTISIEVNEDTDIEADEICSYYLITLLLLMDLVLVSLMS